MSLNVLTAVTRPENLPAVAASLATAAAGAPGIDVCWHWRYDLDREHVGGQEPKNEMLDSVRDGWVWVLDDDTVAHPDLLSTLATVRAEHPNMAALVVSQARADGRTLTAHFGNVRVGDIDIGQAILRRDLIGDQRIPANYEGDGHFLAALLTGRDDVIYHDEILSYHNALEGALTGRSA